MIAKKVLYVKINIESIKIDKIEIGGFLISANLNTVI